MKKKFMLLSPIFMVFLMSQESKAQVHVDLNIGTPVYVAPAPEVNYYYLPDVEAYYYIPTRTYYYMSGGRWIHARYLPGSYRNYNVYHERHIAVYESRPYLHHTYYREHYHEDKHDNRGYQDHGNHGKSGHGNGRPHR